MKTKNAKEIAKIDRQLDRLEAEFATIKKRADELTAQYKRLSPEYTSLMERTEQINKERRALLEQRWALEEYYLPRISNAGRSRLTPGSTFLKTTTLKYPTPCLTRLKSF